MTTQLEKHDLDYVRKHGNPRGFGPGPVPPPKTLDEIEAEAALEEAVNAADNHRFGHSGQ